jgi:two-component system, chemotaxis family, protein-glutamate methylesterase/glutaminase
MPTRDIVVIGGSAGSLPFLREILGDLPAHFPAAVFVVTHLRARDKSSLPQVLHDSGPLPAIEAFDGQHIAKSAVYVAPPDRHMLIAEGQIHLSRGPKEGLHRPSINATFRSAAMSYGDRVIGVLLSGMLDDGASGLWDIVQRKGVAIVQDPEEAEFPSMPMSALESVPVNYKLKSREIGARLVELVSSTEGLPEPGATMVNKALPGKFSGFTCPECRGPLYEYRAQPLEFKCRVGHVFPFETLMDESTSTQERKMYEALVSLQEGADMAEYAARAAQNGARDRLLAEARQLRRHCRAIQGMIEERSAAPVDEPND